MGLEPRVFWSLLVREFWIKYDAFRRAEDRREALMLNQVVLSTHMKEKDRNAMKRRANLLTRYPVKRWLR